MRSENDTSTDLSLFETDANTDGAAQSTNGHELSERQALWPEYGPPNCFWGLCQFEGPPCILWCTEDKVFYGSNDGCKAAPGTPNSAELPAGRPLSLVALTAVAVVLIGMMGFLQVTAGFMQG